MVKRREEERRRSCTAALVLLDKGLAAGALLEAVALDELAEELVRTAVLNAPLLVGLAGAALVPVDWGKDLEGRQTEEKMMMRRKEERPRHWRQ